MPGVIGSELSLGARVVATMRDRRVAVAGAGCKARLAVRSSDGRGVVGKGDDRGADKGATRVPWRSAMT
ncbi:hypothetical protein D3C85_1407950 [compost metagenome]